MRRRILLTLLVLILAAGATFWWWSRPLPILNVVTWPGVYGRAQAAAQIQAFRAERRVDARIQQWAENGTLDELRHAIAAGRAGDVVDLELPVAVAACRAGLLEPIDAAALPPGADGTAAAQDFHKGTIGDCFVASAIYAQIIVCQPCQSAGVSDLAGLFALAARGEKIGLQRGAKINLEMALLAEGVKPEDVYRTLETPDGAARAFARLDTIKRSIVWNAPLAALERGEIGIAAALTADVQALAQSKKLTLLTPQFYESDVLAIPKNGTKKDLALAYLHFATGSAPLANMVKFAPYAPPRRSSRALVAALPAAPMRDFVAGQGDALDRSFAVDDGWWATHGAALEARFRAWADTP